MSLRPSFRLACRTLALRSRPVLPRQEALGWSLSKRRYADDSTTKPPAKPLNQATSTTPAADVSQTQTKGVGVSNPAEDKEGLGDDFSVQSSTEDAIDQLEAALAGLSEKPKSRATSKPGESWDALAEEAAADNSGLTVEEAMGELERAAQGQGSGVGLEGGLTPSQEEHLYREGSIPPTMSDGNAQRDIEVLASGGLLADAVEEQQVQVDAKGRVHKWPLPTLPLEPQNKLKSRYHPVLDQLTNLLMRHGKKSVAQRNMAMILNFLRTSPPPILSQKYPLLPGHPPASHLPLNPVLYMTLAIDSVAPLVRINYIKGGAGGGRALEVPKPLKVRQRRRTAFQWILDVVSKKRSTGSGRTQLAHRIANEIIAVAEGRSSVWEKRQAVHKLGTATRANVNKKPVRSH
ncbi:ribosomal protein S7 [Sodiomyces alkalinus F11]|uniref:Small ribosomal subunit protein uS7m n=1 Tax=Sodiomyces alkalinus (strain CBS 110278 / VKM F-3762 / F11) TaxID=1314773 RepID=A0A3N2PQ83_SODAK|nr:ribosomal protein S7 [Sodiomyces alkalinus F11]ROT36667.1 ribosomal protein S7 [Sodiomyces alkalinus F11]